MKFLFIVLTVAVCLGCVGPVTASEYSQTNVLPPGVFEAFSQKVVEYKGVTNLSHNMVVDGKRVSLVQFTVPANTQTDIVIYYGSNSSVTASSETHVSAYIPGTTIPYRTAATVTMDGVSKTYDFIDTQPYYDFNFAGYAKSNNESAITGFMIYSLNYGALDNDLAVFYPVDDIAVNTIYQIDMTNPETFDAWITTNTAAAVAGGSSKTVIDIAWEWINFSISIGSFVFGLVVTIFYWGKFFLWDNLILTISLYVSLTMAFAARRSRGNMEKFFRQFFSDQRKLFEFFLTVWNTLITIISNFRGIFRI